LPITTPPGINTLFFEIHNLVSGNPVRVGDGCATVTGYKLPLPLILDREGGSEDKPQVRISARLCSSAPFAELVIAFQQTANFSDKEKDEASQPRVCAAWTRWMPSFSDLPGLKVFWSGLMPPESFRPALVSQP